MVAIHSGVLDLMMRGVSIVNERQNVKRFIVDSSNGVSERGRVGGIRLKCTAMLMVFAYHRVF